MPDSGSAHIAAITSVTQPKRRECEECVKIGRELEQGTFLKQDQQ